MSERTWDLSTLLCIGGFVGMLAWILYGLLQPTSPYSGEKFPVWGNLWRTQPRPGRSTSSKWGQTPYPANWEELRKSALTRDGYKCGNCGGAIGLMVHHIVPLSKGGTNSLGNLRTLCEECHRKLHPHMR